MHFSKKTTDQHQGNHPEKALINLTLMASAYLVIIGTIYYQAFSYMVGQWSKDDYSYCYLIPLIVLYLLWEKHREFSHTSSKPTWSALYFLIAGIGFYWLGELGGEFYTLYISAWTILLSICLFHFGYRKVRVILFPLCMILTMFPFPDFINNRITFNLKLISSKLGVLMMQGYGMSAYREGNIIDLGFTQLQVVDACSGLRYLFPMLILSVLMAYLYKSRLWKKVFLVLFTVPLTIFTNALRIALTGILSETYGSQAVEGFFHDFEGWLIFMVTLGTLLSCMWLLDHLFPEPETKTQPQADEAEEKPLTQISSPQFRTFLPLALLCLTLLFSKGIDFREAKTMSKPFTDFPMQISQWNGEKDVLDQRFIDALDFSDYIIADYRDQAGKEINFYVAYYNSQQKGESIHSPATCLRGGGWNFKQSGTTHVPLPGNTAIPVSRGVLEKGKYRQLAYYWFPMRGRMLTNAFQMKWFNFWDALTKQRTDGALVRVIAPVLPGETIAQTEARLQSFIKEVEPILSEYLPGS